MTHLRQMRALRPRRIRMTVTRMTDTTTVEVFEGADELLELSLM